MKKSILFLAAFVLVGLTACEGDDDTNTGNALSVSFANPSLNLTEEVTPVQIVFSGATSSAGSVTVSFTGTNAQYGEDFTTDPAAVGSVIAVPFNSGATSVSISFTKLADAVEGETKNVTFTITEVSTGATISGNSTTQVNFDETASLGNALAAEVGGATQPNQVYADLSSGGLVTVPRVSWDLGFYGGDDFRVAINGSLKMAAKQLETTNIDAVVEADESMIINQGNGSADQIDNPFGNIDGTAIAAISDNDEDNKVYLINMGNGPQANVPTVGSEGSAGGPHRGWKKIRVLKSGSDYVIQYADIDATTHQEVTVSKNAAYNFTFFSFDTNGVVQAEPQKNQWDINFTTFTNLVGGTTPYYYPDFIVTNTKGGARSYMVSTDEISYESFTAANIDASKFTEDQRNIGSNWRSTSVNGPGGFPVSQFVLLTDRFFIVKDPAGNIYKIKMTGGASEAGERGFPTFQYALLQ